MNDYSYIVLLERLGSWATIAVAFFILVEWGTHRLEKKPRERIAEAEQKERKRLDDEYKDKLKDVERNARIEIERLQAQAEQARAEVEKAKLESIRLKHQISWRELTDEKKTELVQILKNHNGSVEITYLDDPESFTFAYDLHFVFKDAGWNTQLLYNSNPAPFFGVEGALDPSHSGRLEFERAVKNLPPPHKLQLDTQLLVFRLNVGYRPRKNMK